MNETTEVLIRANLDTPPETRTNLSTNIVIEAQIHDGSYIAVGAIKQFHISQHRNVTRQMTEDEHGYLRETLVPGNTIITLDIQRVIFDGLSIPEAFGRGFRSIQTQTLPLTIRMVDHIDAVHTTTTTFHNCWFTHMSTPIQADDYIILETASMVCERMSTDHHNNAS